MTECAHIFVANVTGPVCVLCGAAGRTVMGQWGPTLRADVESAPRVRIRGDRAEGRRHRRGGAARRCPPT